MLENERVSQGELNCRSRVLFHTINLNNYLEPVPVIKVALTIISLRAA